MTALGANQMDDAISWAMTMTGRIQRGRVM